MDVDKIQETETDKKCIVFSVTFNSETTVVRKKHKCQNKNVIRN